VGARTAAAVLAAVCSLAIVAPVASGSTLPSGFRDEAVFTDLEEPTALRVAADGRVFVAEKAGRILVFDDLLDNAPTVFADLRTQTYDAGDRGLLALALDPEFPARPYVYALYSYDHLLGDTEPAPKWGEPDQSGDDCPKPPGTGVDACPVSGRLVRLTVDQNGAGDQAVENGAGEADEHVLVEDWCAQYSSHSIGDLQFGSDGALYASGGEGADANGVDYGQGGWPQKNQCGDPPAPVGGDLAPPDAEGGALRAQDVRTPANPLEPGVDPTGLNGSIIRIDPDSGAGWPGNPMIGSTDPNERRIVAFGLRNPFRFAIDPASGEIYSVNVGWNNYKEIDRFAVSPARAFNSGWPCFEGPARNPNYDGLDLDLCEGLYAEAGAATQPFFHYRHGRPIGPGDACSPEAGSAISGLSFYGGGPFPAAYDGALFFADSVRGCIYFLPPGDDGGPDPLAATTFMSDAGLYPGVDLEVGPAGDLYYVALLGAEGEGEIHRISYDPEAPVARLTADPPWGDAPLPVTLDASASSDPGGDTLSFKWDLDGNGSFETSGAATRTETFAGVENVAVAVEVSDGSRTSVARVTVHPGDTPPQPQIEEPLTSLSWGVGEEIEFAGGASDSEDGELEDSSLFWKTRLYHCPSACHGHPLRAYPGAASGRFVAPDHDYPAHIEISLTAVDSRGLAATESVSIYPRTVDLTIASDPAGVELGAGLLSRPAPFQLRAIAGSNLVLSAPATARFGASAYAWAGWSDGGARVHPIVADETRTYTAAYAAVASPDAAFPPAALTPSLLPVAPPRTRIVKRPPPRTRAASASFAFAADAAGIRFRCRLDRGRFTSCSARRTFRNLKPGPHVLRVIAVGATGAADPTPVVYRWTVLEPR